MIALKHFLVHKHEFESLLEKSGSTLSTKKFLRMISFTLIDLLINFPVLLAEFTLELLYKKVEPYTSWDLVHHQFSRVVEYPAYVLDNPEGRKFITVAEMSAWMVCASGIIFFLLFGFSIDARADYAKAQQKLKSWISRRESQTEAQRYAEMAAAFTNSTETSPFLLLVTKKRKSQCVNTSPASMPYQMRRY